jgi:stage II sporulation protein D
MRRITLLTALVVVATFALPALAGAATRHVVRGAGWGHGIGMSQYGAYGFAQNGRSYKQILAHYYRGTELSQARTRTIRVLLMANRRDVSFSGATRASTRRLDAARSYRARVRDGKVELRTSRGRRVARFGAPLRVTGAGIRLAGTAIGGKSSGRYRGALELRPSAGGGLTVVNALGLDSYVQGVVPKESPSSWPAEALKAQAVAARSYALTTDAGGAVFDQYPDVRSQVYRGMDEEAASTNAAVQATAGEILRYDGEVATTFFFSTSGGHTENIENVWYGSAPKPYLRGVEDPYDDASPHHRWRLEFSQDALEAKLGDWVKGNFRRVDVVKRGVSPRIVSADIVGSAGETRVSGTSLRARLGLRDTWATFTRIDANAATGRASGKRARTAGWMGWLFAKRTHFVEGRFSPAPRGGVVTLERRRDGRWKATARARVNSAGDFRARVHAAGAYRVRAGSLVGPTVSVP